MTPDPATRKLWQILMPLLGLQDRKVTHLVLELGMNVGPKLTVTEHVIGVGGETTGEEHVKTFTLIETTFSDLDNPPCPQQ